jgi:glycosyltransferase involved in cell wall biosynthesis
MREMFGGLPALDRVRWVSGLNLPDYLTRVNYHVFHHADTLGFPHLRRLRDLYAPHPFPVTAMTHTLSYGGMAGEIAACLPPGAAPCDALLASSRAGRSALESMWTEVWADSGSPPRFPLIPLGVDPEEFHDPQGERAAVLRASVRIPLGLAEDDVLLLVFARLDQSEKMDFLPLFRALARALGAGGRPGKIALLFAGAVSQESRLPALLVEAAGEIDLLCRIIPNPDDEVRSALYAAADIFVSPVDNIQESFGLTLLEAGVSGLPVVASDFDGYRDIVEPGATGLLVPTFRDAAYCGPGFNALALTMKQPAAQSMLAQQTVVSVPHLAEALLRLIRNPLERKGMGLEARRRILASLTWDHCVTRCLDLWEELRAIGPETGRDAPETARAVGRVAYAEDYARIFAVWPSEVLEAGRGPLLRLTAYARSVALGQSPMRLWDSLSGLVTETAVRALIELADKPATLEELATALAARVSILPENARYCLFWALKHDYLERVEE